MVQALVRELEIRKNYLQGKSLKTIYFGGGTPSLLEETELSLILNTIRELHLVDKNVELTIECNPEDLTTEKLQSLKNLGFNRLSIGIQTFDDAILKYLNRVHDSSQAEHAVLTAQKQGFDNITIDLMYALPFSTKETLQRDVEKAVALNVPHISAYCFTLEEKTVFGKWEKQQKLERNSDEHEQSQYELLHSYLASHGYEQYEISNFARDNHYSKHNTAYWFGAHYLGIGPGAHSFNGTERMWNVSNNNAYIQELNQNKLACETELLSVQDRINETILTRLRTKWGVPIEKLKTELAFDLQQEKHKELANLIDRQLLFVEDHHLHLTEKGKLVADKIVVELMV